VVTRCTPLAADDRHSLSTLEAQRHLDGKREVRIKGLEVKNLVEYLLVDSPTHPGELFPRVSGVRSLGQATVMPSGSSENFES
jgi:hypothetical protein